MKHRLLRAHALFAVLGLSAQAADTNPALAAPTPATAPAAQSAPLSDSDSVIAVVEDRIITVADLRREIIPRLDALQGIAHNQLEYNKLLDGLESDLLNELINRILIVKDFQKDPKRHIPGSYIDNAISETLLNAPFDGDRSKFLTYLRVNGWTLRDYRKKVEEDIIYSVMRNQQHKNESVVSPVRIETYYKDNLSKFFQEAAVHYRTLTLRRSEGEADDQLLKRMDPVQARLKAGEKFEALAKELSQDPRQDQGGDWGWSKKSDLSPEFSLPLFTIAPGQTSDPIVNSQGCFLLQLVERKDAGTQTLAEVSGEIEKILAAQMARDAEDRWIQRLRANAFISISREFVTPNDPSNTVPTPSLPTP